MMPLEYCQEYDAAAEWCAKRGLKGDSGCPLPNLMDSRVVEAINEDPDAFAERVRLFSYAMAMEAVKS